MYSTCSIPASLARDAPRKQHRHATCIRIPLAHPYDSTLQEVVRRSAGHHWLAGARAWVELKARYRVSKRLWRARCVHCVGTYKVYLRCSSISMIAAWLPQR